MANIQSPLAQAFQLHQAGRLGEAISLYLKLLPQQKKNFELLYLLGSANLQIGQRPLELDLRMIHHQPRLSW